MKAYYTDHFVLPLPDDHRFPMRKYSRLREKIIENPDLAQIQLCVPDAATDEQILRVHSLDYLEKVKHGGLTRREIIRMGFPWSPGLVERSRRSSGATLAAARAAMIDGVSVNLAGGTHHAGYEHGEGYCVWNDSVVAARALQAEKSVERVIVIDCDVHQGNGTAALTKDDDTIYAFSMHGLKNFPFRKIYGDLDIGLRDDTDDDTYLSMLEIALERVFFTFNADLAIYIAGADAYYKDKLGKLSLTASGMAAKDHMVLQACYDHEIPVAVTMGGGYAENVDDIASIHLQTVVIAAEYWQKWHLIRG